MTASYLYKVRYIINYLTNNIQNLFSTVILILYNVHTHIYIIFAITYVSAFLIYRSSDYNMSCVYTNCILVFNITQVNYTLCVN